MKKIFFILAVAALAVVSCKPKTPPTYKDAEEAFQESLTSEDTTYVLQMTEAFLELLKAGEVDMAMNQLNTIYEGKLYKAADASIEQMMSRFKIFPVEKYELVRYSFSTQANNDVCYRYFFDDTHSMKIVFNPVKIDGKWYLALKDGNQSSLDMDEDHQVNPNSVIPEEITLNR